MGCRIQKTHGKITEDQAKTSWGALSESNDLASPEEAPTFQ